MGRHSADAASAVPDEHTGRSDHDIDDDTDTMAAVARPPPPPGYRGRVAVAVGVALLGIVLLVFGFISLITTNDPPPASGQGSSPAPPATAGSSAATAAETAATQAPGTGQTSAAPAVVPVTVLNNSSVVGLASRVACALEAAGWPIAELLNYNETQVPATTVYFTAGNAAEEAGAHALAAQFPEITGGVEPRFDGLDGTGLTVAAVGDWLP